MHLKQVHPTSNIISNPVRGGEGYLIIFSLKMAGGNDNSKIVHLKLSTMQFHTNNNISMLLFFCWAWIHLLYFSIYPLRQVDSGKYRVNPSKSSPVITFSWSWWKFKTEFLAASDMYAHTIISRVVLLLAVSFAKIKVLYVSHFRQHVKIQGTHPSTSAPTSTKTPDTKREIVWAAKAKP